MIRDIPCGDFISELASKAPTPGGGGAAALCGAIGAALGNMVGSLTVGKAKYADVEEDMKAMMEKAERLQNEFLALADEDALAFMPLAEAYSLPKTTPEETAYRDEVMEKCLYAAADVPVKIMEKCGEAIDMLTIFAQKGSLMAISDAGCGLALCRGALESAALNVLINAKSMKDREEAQTYIAKVNELVFIYKTKAETVFEMVKRNLK